MIHIVVCNFLCYFAITDILEQKIPNRLIIAAAMMLSVMVGVKFILYFSLAFALAMIMPRILGGGDLKVICLLIGVYGIEKTARIILIGFIICLILNFRKDLKTRLSLAPYILGGFICVELFQF